MADLLNCPFCGGAAHIEQFGNTRMSTIYECDECGCRLETSEEFSHGRAWNRRAQPPQHGAWKPDRADVAQAIHDWVREDAPLNQKMTWTPSLNKALEDRILALSSNPEGES